MLPFLMFRNATGFAQAWCMFRDPNEAWDSAVLRAVLLAQTLAAIVVMLVNGFTMAAIWPRRHRRSTQSSLFVLHLAFADTLVGLSKFFKAVICLDCYLAELSATHEIFCVMPVVLSIFTWTLSATTLAAIAVDRYVCVVHSLRYYEFMNTRRVVVTLAGLWVGSAVCSLLYLPTWHWKEGRFCEEQTVIPQWHLLAVQVPLSFLVLAVVAATHLAIRSEAQRNEARAHCPWVASNRSSASVRSAKIVLLVVGGFLMTDVPMKVFQILHMVDHRDQANFWTYLSLEIFSTLWYLLNPVVYAWKNASIREDMTVLWLKIRDRLWCDRVDDCRRRQPAGASRF